MSEQQEKVGVRARVQKFGSFLSSMIMPNIAAFIAWGLITALFIPDGWFPNEDLAAMVEPMIYYLLPLLIAFTGGRLIHGLRGGVVAATAAMGVIVGSPDTPMFLGAMVAGPIAGYCMKKVDEFFEGKVRQGFEMLVNNFSAGILGAGLAILAYFTLSPLFSGITDLLGVGVDVLISAGLLPLANLFIEPAKVVFLNNAINHGILTPLGTEQSVETGKSILFLLEANPGPGLGVLLAFMFFGKGVSKQTAPGAAIIQFIGGIHEIYFPYILSKPLVILGAIAGGISGTATFAFFNAGLTAAASPGSIIAIMGMTPRGNYLGVAAGVAVAATVSFIVSSIILKASKDEDEGDIEEATAKMEGMKGKKSSVSGQLSGKQSAETSTENRNTNEVPKLDYSKVDKIIFACDAGMGSSAMGSSLLKNKFKKADLDIEVTNMAINDLPQDVDVVITHKDLTERAKQKVPNAHHISVDNFLNSPKYDELAEELQNKTASEEVKTDGTAEVPEVDAAKVDKIIFACDAGMGSSAMGASLLKNKFKKAGIDINVTNMAINDLPQDVDIVITHKDLTERAKQKVPSAYHVSVDNFLNSPKYDELVAELQK
ncbi:PTS mannitol-specific transporter subunit IIBC [Halobacillus halophilus]|uniref:PTS mannitol-specific transporter subunit IIBC n=1 Tax=Halobacillus halophilus TaxID=1570 RepID=UPI001CD7C22C|nr:PTS mannitol-specific transporter subunit IIBC [Halobacillus halophilus]MCA1010175.1 PTS mannitol transporter subunit IICBA [Halobacillus halophilus]